MVIKEFIRKALEQEYLGETIYNWNKSTTFVVDRITVEDGGVDPQWEITLHSKSGVTESFTMTLANDNMPEIVETSEEEEIEEDLGLDSCEQCGEDAWDGYICHACGMKNI